MTSNDRRGVAIGVLLLALVVGLFFWVRSWPMVSASDLAEAEAEMEEGRAYLRGALCERGPLFDDAASDDPTRPPPLPLEELLDPHGPFADCYIIDGDRPLIPGLVGELGMDNTYQSVWGFERLTQHPANEEFGYSAALVPAELPTAHWVHGLVERCDGLSEELMRQAGASDHCSPFPNRFDSSTRRSREALVASAIVLARIAAESNLQTGLDLLLAAMAVLHDLQTGPGALATAFRGLLMGPVGDSPQRPDWPRVAAALAALETAPPLKAHILGRLVEIHEQEEYFRISEYTDSADVIDVGLAEAMSRVQTSCVDLRSCFALYSHPIVPPHASSMSWLGPRVERAETVRAVADEELHAVRYLTEGWLEGRSAAHALRLLVELASDPSCPDTTRGRATFEVETLEGSFTVEPHSPGIYRLVPPPLPVVRDLRRPMYFFRCSPRAAGAPDVDVN